MNYSITHQLTLPLKNVKCVKILNVSKNSKGLNFLEILKNFQKFSENLTFR